MSRLALWDALITSAVFVVILHFVLRSTKLRFVWHSLQLISGMRRTLGGTLGAAMLDGHNSGS